MHLVIANKSVEMELSPEIEQLAEIIGDDEKVLQLIQAFSGTTIYIPQKVNREIENHKILVEFDDLISCRSLQEQGVRDSGSTLWENHQVDQGDRRQRICCMSGEP